MAKYTNHRKMAKSAQEEIFVQFARTISKIKDPVEAAHFIKDLLSEQESLMLARRLCVADLLDQGFTYAQIKRAMPVSDPTISKVQAWLQAYGEGFRNLLIRARKKPAREAFNPTWRDMKRKMPMYFWPSLLLEEIVRSANRRQRERLAGVLEELREKTSLTRRLQTLLRQSAFSNKT